MPAARPGQKNFHDRLAHPAEKTPIPDKARAGRLLDYNDGRNGKVGLNEKHTMQFVKVKDRMK